MKRNKILIFVMLLAFLTLTFFGLKVSATTSTDSSLLTIEGAQVRLEGVNGIRFKGNVDTNFDKTGVTGYGIALAFGEVPVSDVVVGNTVNGKSVLYGEVTDLVDDSYYVNLINIPETMYGQKVTARSYVVKDGERLYSDTAKTRSLGYVALYSKSQGYSSTLLDSIITTLNNNYMKAYTIGDNVHINNPVYVYEPTKLAEYFIKDFNSVIGTSLTTMVGFAKANMGKWVSDPGTFSNTDIQNNNLYKELISNKATFVVLK